MEFFLIEIRTSDWSRSLAWYRDVLGLSLSLIDEPLQYALLAAGPGRIALKSGQSVSESGNVRITFRVDLLDEERSRLIGLGVAVSDPISHPEEGFREIRLFDPDGTPISLFAWELRE